MAQGSGLLSPNQPLPKASNPEDGPAQPTEEERRLAKQVDKLFEKAAKSRKKYDKDWIDNYRMFRGDQWLKRRPGYKHKEVINLIFETIQSQVSVMLDTRPQVGFLPQDPTDLPFAEVLAELFQADWDRNNWLDEITQVVMDAHIYSVGMSCCSYDEYLNNGAGGVAFHCEDPLDFYPDPEATNVNKKAEYFICAKPMDIDKVKKKWAHSPYIDQIKPDLEDMSYERRQVTTLHKRKHSDLDMAGDDAAYGSSSEDSQDKVLVVYAYLHPSDTEVIEKEDQDADGEKLYITRKKYPHGRMVVKIGQFIMEDGPLPYDDLEFPFQRLINYVLPREFYGISEIDNTKGPQMTFNKLVNFALDVMTLMGNPIWKVPTEGNVNTRKLVNQPGLIVEYANGAIGEPKREEGVQLQPFVLDLIDRMEQWFNNIAGTQDVTRGINPPGVTANAAIENLLETASKRIKQKMRNLDSYMRDFGRQWVSRVMQFYTAPQVYRITNKEEANQFFKFNVEHRETGEIGLDGKPKTQKVAIVRKAFKGEDGQMTYEERPSEYEIRGDFDVKINTISGLPFNKAENEQRLLALFDRQIIDQEEVLTKMDYPNKEKILQRMQAQAEAAAAAEQQPPQQGVA